jgi:HSP20 family protein
MNAIAENQNAPARSQDQPRPERPRGFITPPANISANPNEYLLELEMPGVDKEGIEIMAEGNELTVLGRRKNEMPNAELLYTESALADYRRSFELGPDVDTSRISAEMSQGVLKLHLPKSEKAKPRKIQIAG